MYLLKFFQLTCHSVCDREVIGSIPDIATLEKVLSDLKLQEINKIR